jgi:hypothetical protein
MITCTFFRPTVSKALSVGMGLEEVESERKIHERSYW